MTSCADCKFYSQFGGNTTRGDCRAHPPTMHGFPETVALNWCGEFKSSKVGPFSSGGGFIGGLPGIDGDWSKVEFPVAIPKVS